jgi:hypothetical protein
MGQRYSALRPAAFLQRAETSFRVPRDEKFDLAKPPGHDGRAVCPYQSTTRTAPLAALVVVAA